MCNFRQALVQVGGRPRLSRFCSRYCASSLIFCTVGRLGAVLGRYFSMGESIGGNLCRTSSQLVLGHVSGRFCTLFPSDCMRSSRWAVLQLLSYAVLGMQRAREFCSLCLRRGACFYRLFHVAYSVVPLQSDLPVKIDVVPILIKLGSKLL